VVAISSELHHLASDLPAHKENILRRMRDIFGEGPGVWAGLAPMFDAVGDFFRARNPEQGFSVPVTISDEKRTGFEVISTTLSPILSAIGSVGLVIALTVAMLFKREDLRNRLIRLAGHTQLTRTTRAIDEATRRISRYLVLQVAVNAGFGLLFGLGLALFGVPYPALWGILATVVRFIPYVGTWLAAVPPLIMS